MAFIQQEQCDACGEVKDINLSIGNTCGDCREQLQRQKKLDWMNNQNEKTLEERLKIIENYIYDNFVDTVNNKFSIETLIR